MRVLLVCFLFTFFAPIMAGAAPITLVLEGTTAGGKLGDTFFFSYQTFRISISSDTTGTEIFDGGDSNGGWVLPSVVATISITGIGTADFTTMDFTGPTLVFVNHYYKSLGFSRGTLDAGGDLIGLSCTIDCSTWDLTTSFGPVYNRRPLYSGFGFPIETTLGSLKMDSLTDVTFEAVVTPEPTSGLLVAAGLAALAVRRRG
jgi:PEP-CTERM motif-containing protein